MAPTPAVLPESFSGEKAKVVYAATITLDIPAGRDFKHEAEIPVARSSGDRTMSPEPVTIRYPGFFRALVDGALTLLGGGAAPCQPVLSTIRSCA